MDNKQINDRFKYLNTAVIVDACLRAKVEYRIANTGIKPINPNTLLAGNVRPVKHFGSVDIFLEAILNSKKGDVLVIDNQGRLDEACVGDLTALELRAHGLSGFIIWGLHRDEKELLAIDFPTLSYGSFPSGPVRLDSTEEDSLSDIEFCNFRVTNYDVVFADINGVVFFEKIHVKKILGVAENIWRAERIQMQQIEKGVPLTEQLKFNEYLEMRSKSEEYTFRQHLRKIGGEIEE
ncbi:MAG: putative regulator of ribonuclease activity [Candidatus Heimdallarchaeota archaeon LC_2]|nr:MAG: putative regulator of ribonuclease activity [Candidatus Heimdallarchaeota archaeon LC_2]